MFRKIKHKLLTNGRIKNYLKYALGEVLLIVIGILIAVSINNWNRNRAGEVAPVPDVEDEVKGGQPMQLYGKFKTTGLVRI